MRTDTPRRDPELWQVAIGGTRFGIRDVTAELIGLETASVFDKAKASGVDGATIKFKGEELATFSIKLTAVSREGLDIILDACEAVRNTSRSDGIPVVHPMLARAGVMSMIVEKVKWPDCSDPNRQVAEFSCVQWRKAVPAKTKTIASTNAPAPGDLLSTSKRPPPKRPKGPWEKTPAP